jgi:predicted permease
MRPTPKHWLYTIPLRLRSLLRRGSVERELSDELQYHLEQKTREFIAAGLTPEEARRRARREFGGLEQSKENCRDTRRVRLIETMVQDVRFGLRMLWKSPGFTAIAVLTLGLGIGANTAIFSMVNSFLLRPLPVKDADQITVLAMRLKKGPLQTQFSVPEYRDLQTQSISVFSDVFATALGEGGLTFNGKTEPIVVDYVSGNYFTTLAIQPVLGRFILPSEGDVTTVNPVIVIGYSFWQTRFGGDPNIIGKTVEYDGHPVTIIGVVPKEFHGLYAMADMQGYLPLGMQQLESTYDPAEPTNRADRNLLLYARLLPGVTVAQAQSAVDVIDQRLSQQYPKDDDGLAISVFLERFSRPDPDPSSGLLKVATLFLILAALVLILACVNIANFLLVRASARRREMAIRTALGGSRTRLIRQLLTESILLALCGGIAGILLGLAGSHFLSSIHVGTTLPVLLDFHLDWRVFGYAFAAAMLTGLLVGIVPALRASRRGIMEALRDGGRGTTGARSRLRSVLVVAQVGGSLMLLIVAALMARSLNHAQRSDLGFDPRHVLNLTMDPGDIGMKKQQGLGFYNRLLERLQAMPEVASASVAFSVPMGYYDNYDWPVVQGYEVPEGAPKPVAGFNTVTPDYFRTMAIPLLEGRAFTKADIESAPWVAIISEKMAKRFWPNESAIGHEFRMASIPNRSLRIVGVVKDSRTTGMLGPIREYFYVPMAQQYTSLATLQVRTAGAPENMTAAIREQIASLAPTMPVFDVHTMLAALYTVNGFLLFQLAAVLAAVLGSLGLILALVGVFGVISFTVSQRVNEIGIRMAMGAAQASILRMILRQGIWIIATGLLAGVLLAVAIARLVGNFIVGISPYDPLTYISVSGALCAVALLACYLPARRATRVDPVVALRYE